MIAFSEGTSTIKGSDDGYNVVVGGTLFFGYDDHPRELVRLNKNLTSTAAGRYQVLARYYDAYKTQLHLPDFGHASQDAIAMQLIKECKALGDIDAGNFQNAVKKCRSRWASLPGAGYRQHENAYAELEQAYREAGGMVA